MSDRIAEVTFLENKQPDGPVHRSIMGIDLEGSTTRIDPAKGEIRRVMYELLGHSLEAVAVTGNRLEPVADRGDGALVLIKPHDDVPKTMLLNRLVPLLSALLTEYNAQAASPELRIRMRVVMHAGEVQLDRRGFYGETVDIAVRLLNARTVKKALKQSQAPLVLVVSDEIYAGVVRHGCLDAAAYRALTWVTVAGRRHRGWVYLPGAATTPAAGSAGLARPRPSLLSPGPAIADKRLERQVVAIIERTLGNRVDPAAG